MREKWIAKREADLLNVSYFHVVFTLPDHLNELALQQPKLIYGLLFATAWEVIWDFGANPKMLGAKTGMIAVLHTWGQNLSLHPHLHCIVPAGGITAAGKWKSTKSRGSFLFPVKAMGKVFRARFVQRLRKEATVSPSLSDKLFTKPWVVYAKRPFFGPRQVIEYLGRYTHKIAITNSRICDLSDGQVCFRAKNYRQDAKPIMLKLDCREFIRRFALHIMPKGYTRIRHFGILNGRVKGAYKKIVDQQRGSIILDMQPEPRLHRMCPECKKGKMQTIVAFDQRGPPSHWWLKLQDQKK